MGEELDRGLDQHLDRSSEHQQRGAPQTTPLGVPSRIRRQGPVRCFASQFPVLRLFRPRRELWEQGARLLLLPVELPSSFVRGGAANAGELDRSFGQPASPSSLIATLVRMYSSFCLPHK